MDIQRNGNFIHTYFIIYKIVYINISISYCAWEKGLAKLPNLGKFSGAEPPPFPPNKNKPTHHLDLPCMIYDLNIKCLNSSRKETIC